MNPLVCASLTFLLTVFQAVAVEAKGKKGGSKSTSKRRVPLIAGVVVAVVVVLAIIGIIIFLRMRSRRARRMDAPLQPHDAPYISGGHTGHPNKEGNLGYPDKEGHSAFNPPTAPSQFTNGPSFPVPHGQAHP